MTQTYSNITKELNFLKDKWTNKPHKGQYKKDKARYWELRTELTILKIEAIFGGERNYLTYKERSVRDKAGKSAIIWCLTKKNQLVTLVSR